MAIYCVLNLDANSSFLTRPNKSKNDNKSIPTASYFQSGGYKVPARWLSQVSFDTWHRVLALSGIGTTLSEARDLARHSANQLSCFDLKLGV